MERTTPNELPIPSLAIEHRSVEMIRVWLANDQQHVSLNIGFWEDRGIDERSAWGILLADMIHHIANAHNEEYGHDVSESLEKIKAGFLAELENSTSERIGEFVNSPQRDDKVD